MTWFSAKTRCICLIEGIGGISQMDSIYIFRAPSFREAKNTAIILGRQAENEYTNADGQCVRWKLKEILTLDEIENQKLDGAEVYSESIDIQNSDEYRFEVDFHPELSSPTQTI